MSKKHILDIDEWTWSEIKKLKLDRGETYVNDTLLYLLRKGLVVTGTEYVKGEDTQHLVIAAVGGSMLQSLPPPADDDKAAAGAANYEQPAEKGDKTPAPTRQINKRTTWSAERLAKMKKEMAEKYGAEFGKPVS